MVAEGRIERETEHAEVSITHLICRRLINRSDLLGQLNHLEDDPVPASEGLNKAGKTTAVRALPLCRDFR